MGTPQGADGFFPATLKLPGALFFFISHLFQVMIVLFDDLGDKPLFTALAPKFPEKNESQAQADKADQNIEANPPGPFQDQGQSEDEQNDQ